MTPAVPTLARTRHAGLSRAATKWALGLLALCPMACTSVPRTTSVPQATVASLMSRPLPDMPGKEGEMIMVEYAPGAVDPVHRHDAHAFLYVLEGSVVMQVRGGDEVTLTPGQTFYEGPDDVHVVGRNASSTEPAKFLVFFVKEKGAPVLVPAQ